MVDAQTYLDTNYPLISTCIRTDDKENYGKTRNQIINLDISNQNLENVLTLNGFNNLRQLNISFNQLTNFFWNQANIEEVDVSHNKIQYFNSDQLLVAPLLQKLNLSYNNLGSELSSNIPNLAYLDASNNYLTGLNLTNSGKLIKLNCSNNPLTNLSLPSSLANLNSFDCLGTKLVKDNNISSLSPTSTVFVTETISVPASSSNFSNNIPMITTAGSLGVLLPVAIATILYYRYQWKKAWEQLSTREQLIELTEQTGSNSEVSLPNLTGQPIQSNEEISKPIGQSVPSNTGQLVQTSQKEQYQVQIQQPPK